MKKTMTCALTALMAVSALSLPVYAQDASTEFSFVKKNDPTYTVSIPSSLALSEEGTPMTIEAKDVAYLDGKKVSVTVAGTNYYRNQLVIQARTSKPSYTGVIRYQLISPDNKVYETKGDDTVTGTELASFTENGTVIYTVKPVLYDKINLEPGLKYTGTMNFGISLTD